MYMQCSCCHVQVSAYLIYVRPVGDASHARQVDWLIWESIISWICIFSHLKLNPFHLLHKWVGKLKSLLYIMFLPHHKTRFVSSFGPTISLLCQKASHLLPRKSLPHTDCTHGHVYDFFCHFFSPFLYGATYSDTMISIELFIVCPYMELRAATPCLLPCSISFFGSWYFALRLLRCIIYLFIYLRILLVTFSPLLIFIIFGS